MSLKGDNDRYGSVAIVIHWLSALAILCMFVLGILAVNADAPAHKAAILQVHVPLGALILLLTLFRIVWLFVGRRPSPLPGLPQWQTIAEHLVHIALYLLIVVMGGSGIAVMVLSGAAPILFAGSASALPDFPTYSPMVAHVTGAVALFGFMCLHIVAALYHQFIRRDRVLYRMGIGASERYGEKHLGRTRSKLSIS